MRSHAKSTAQGLLNDVESHEYAFYQDQDGLPKAAKSAVVFALAFIIGLFFILVCSCATTKEDVAKTETEAALDTNAAYNDADEEAVKTEHDANEKALKIAAEANEKIDKAYDKAEAVENHSDQKVAKVRRDEFIDSTRKYLNQRLATIRAMKKSDKSSVSEPRVAQLEGIANNLETRLQALKKIDPVVWENQRPDLEQSLANFEENYKLAVSSTR